MNIQDEIQKHITYIPYEGYEIDKNSIEVFIFGLMKGLITFANTFEHDSNGYHKHGKYYSKDEIIQMFLNQIPQI